MELVLGDNVLDVSQGTCGSFLQVCVSCPLGRVRRVPLIVGGRQARLNPPPSTLQEVVAIDSQEKSLHVLGQLSGKMLVTPDFAQVCLAQGRGKDAKGGGRAARVEVVAVPCARSTR